MRRECEPAAYVSVGDNEVTIIRVTALNEAVVAGLLAAEDSGATLYLDRLVHAPWEDALGEWRCSGAVSTILRRKEAVG